ncbi:hypothetical protein FB00_11260 [Cellulosimicrobium funkei]|uniref:Uncharacterized protein n=1 Tax=Cellulosimicrobium funkei TaxID=264251 RepID=A0A0H2KN63_9MICO|nr:hypothetical protein FB00_11260 [Cellulosimicrobium funkei]
MRCFRPSAVGWWWCADHIEQGWAPKTEPTPDTWTKSTHTRYHTKRGVSAPDRCPLCAAEAER